MLLVLLPHAVPSAIATSAAAPTATAVLATASVAVANTGPSPTDTPSLSWSSDPALSEA